MDTYAAATAPGAKVAVAAAAPEDAADVIIDDTHAAAAAAEIETTSHHREESRGKGSRCKEAGWPGKECGQGHTVMVSSMREVSRLPGMKPAEGCVNPSSVADDSGSQAGNGPAASW